MKVYQGQQTIKQLEKRKGGYYYLKIDSELVENLTNKRATRLVCQLEDEISYRCGLNHLGDGNFFIIVAGKYLEKLNKELGDTIKYSIEEDPDQLGVEMPEVLSVFLNQEPEYKAIFDSITDGKKRSLIYKIIKVKDIDLQVRHIIDFLDEQRIKK